MSSTESLVEPRPTSQPVLRTSPEVAGPLLSPAKRRVESIDAFRGFTILAMLFVIQVSGYRNLPLTFPQFGSAPVTTFKHAGDDSEPPEWEFWAKNHGVPNPYRPGKIAAVGKDHTYSIGVTDAEGKAMQRTYEHQRVNAAIPLHIGDPVIAVYPREAVAGFDSHVVPEVTPAFQQTGNGCTFTDLVAPFFVFIVGVCIPLSRQSRGKDWWKHALARTAMLIIAGVIYISLVLKASYWWGILQAIGVAYFMGAAYGRLRPSLRWVAVATTTALHAWLTWHVSWWVYLVPKETPFLTVANLHGNALAPLTVHCTPWGSISYGLLTVLGTFIGDAIVTRESRGIIRQCLIVGITCTVAGYLLHRFQAPMNKDYVSPSYSIFTAGIGALTFLAFYWVIDMKRLRAWAWPLNVFGSNALLAYFMQPIQRMFLTALGLIGFFQGRAGLHGVMWGLIWTALLWCIILYFNRRKIYWKL